jgi:6-phosphogluconolactonase
MQNANLTNLAKVESGAGEGARRYCDKHAFTGDLTRRIAAKQGGLPVPPKIFVTPAAEWSSHASTLILAEIQNLSLPGQRPSVMLTGGRSALTLYSFWAKSPVFLAASNVDYYLGDERCVPAGHVESNSGMVTRHLFGQGMPAGCRFFPMTADGDKENLARDYEKILPERLDVLLLSVGEDGHVASLFPGTAALEEQTRRVVQVWGPKPPHDRLTITPRVIRSARAVFLLAQGEQKAKLLGRVLAGGEAGSLPIALAMDATWLLDTPIPGANEMRMNSGFR